MNWITYGNVSNLSKYDLENADYCEHAEEDSSLGVKYGKESDSFGTVGIYIQCEECFEHNKEQDRHNTCYDCGEDKKTTQWRWYDFYAAQGDEALEICDECWDKPTHQHRISQDNINRREEEEDYQDSSDEDYY